MKAITGKSETLFRQQRERSFRAAEQTTRKKKAKANIVYLKKEEGEEE